MHKRRARMLGTIVLVLMSATLSADRVRLRSGKAVEGLFLSGDSKAVRLLLANGSKAEFAVEDVTAVEFTPRRPPSPPPPDPGRAPAPVTVPKGTTLNVRLLQAIDVDSAQAGMSFRSTVDDPVMLDGTVVIPRGATAVLQVARVEQSGKMKGSDKITLKMNSVSFGGVTYEVSTTQVESKGKGEGKRTARKVGGGVGLGAIVGGIAGGGEGAAVGALVGGVAGAAVAGGGEEQMKLPPQTPLQFQLNAAVTIRP
jgi:hypothetical protein